jgi:hypothetical protein
MTGFLAARAGRWTCSGRTIWTPALRLSRGVPAKAEQAELLWIGNSPLGGLRRAR